MRTILATFAAMAILGGATVAFAAEASGTIKALDMSKHSVTLNNGSTYDVAKDVKLDGLKIGEKVMLTYSQSGKTMDVTSIKPAA
jgi:Cu/Ag efflux protein CusF